MAPGIQKARPVNGLPDAAAFLSGPIRTGTVVLRPREQDSPPGAPSELEETRLLAHVTLKSMQSDPEGQLGASSLNLSQEICRKPSGRKYTVTTQVLLDRRW